jgi:transcriptional regulator with XRE-family HTH domain
MPGVTRIGPRRPRRLYLAEWRSARGLTQAQLGDRIDVTDMTISRWERGTAQLNTGVMAAIAEALDIEPADLYRHPDQPSADALLRGQPQSVVDQAITIIEAIRRK